MINYRKLLLGAKLLSCRSLIDI